MPAPKGNKNAVGNEGGRPTKYKPEFCGQAYKLCLLGFTDDDLAKYFEVSGDTIHEWKLTHVEFSDSLKAGKEIADAEVAESFYKRAKGFENEEVKIFQYEGEPVIVPFMAYYPPDAGAALNWLKNRQKKKWRDKIESGFTDSEGNDVPVQVFRMPDNNRSQLKPDVGKEQED